MGAYARRHVTPDRAGQAESERLCRIVQRPFRDECLNEHWFTSLAHTQVLIEAWRREYNEERPKKGLGGLTPSQYAKRLVAERSTVTIGL